MFDFVGFMQFANNPMAYMQKMGIPFNVSMDQIPQFLMNSGKLSQQQYNQIIQQANQLQKTPQFMQLINKFNSPT